MPVIVKRQSWSGNEGARWAFFAVFIVILIVVIFGTLRVNRKRSRSGLQPIYGTRWMTPPSYNQSQNQYNQPNQRRDPDMPQTYVPTYTAEAGEYDMGFYDERGEFHANPNAKPTMPQIQRPEPAHHRDNDNGSADDLELGDISRPVGPPPRATTTDATIETTGEASSSSSNPDPDPIHDADTTLGRPESDSNHGDDFRPPPGPPPVR